MVFQAYLIKANSSPAINVSLIGIILFLLSVFGWAFEATQQLALICTIAGFVLVLVGAVAGKGKGLFEVDKEILSIDDEKISIGPVVYPFAGVSQLQFYYHSFYGQSPFGYFTETSGLIEYGMNNTIRFRYNKLDVTATFYLANMEHANQFFALLTYLKERKIRSSLYQKQARR
jgi:hypothetical protein